MARPALSRIPTDAIRSELDRRERLITPLQRRRAVAATKLALIDRALATLGATAPAARRSGMVDGRQRRARNKQSLAQALAAVLQGRTMSVKDAADAVRRAGYRTASKHFYTQVNIALIKSGKFRRVAHGKYQTKSNG